MQNLMCLKVVIEFYRVRMNQKNYLNSATGGLNLGTLILCL